MDGSQYCILWNNYHGSLVNTLSGLRREGDLVDVTVVCGDGNKVRAHQLVLAACSTYFRDFLRDNPSKHPIVLLPMDIRYPELKAMVDFMYTGQVCVNQERLQSFIRGARYLRIKGLEDNADDSDIEDLAPELENEKGTGGVSGSGGGGTGSGNGGESIATTTIKGRRVKDHRYTQQVDLGDSDDNRDKWEVVERKPVILPRSQPPPPPGSLRRRRRARSALRKRAMHLSNNIVCYEQRTDGSDGNQERSEPINKIRRLGSPGHFHDDDLDICTCTSRKIWSVRDTEALLKVWRETLTQVPPSYFIRSMALCKRVAQRLQGRGIQKSWRQCQVKMKNLRREVRLYKESMGRNSSRKPSEVATACEKLLPDIEDIFNKEEGIRREWYQMRAEERLRAEGRLVDGEAAPADILAQVAVLADSDLGDDDTDAQECVNAEGMETEGDGGAFTEGEGAFTEGEGFEGDVGTHVVHAPPDTAVHHIVEDVTLQVVTKQEPHSGADL
ncbi:hypothetical protein Pcinc_021261 [Petrolisthes cinctipes]|uniref:BTB domain-containing protein n=1 Tax=Petrolisthes cinctipes TaxID=88211 RepID=A0AAE1FHK8_PETCI|nr:hypothetical protein Pcinc_021261 [Petrolisthes cinctipes]